MNCFTPQEIYVKGNSLDDGKYQVVPCGKCLVCLQNKRNDWAFRIMQEYKHSKSAAFLTLTYSEKFVPHYGVNKTHFQLFMKRLRKRSGDRLRYYAVGEYGSQTGRPHYHAIVFNFQGDIKFLQEIWPYGLCHIGKVNESTAMYCTKYVIQKGCSPSSEMSKPFSLMSRAFGIGLWYLTDSMLSWHRDGERNFAMVHDKRIRLPRYFKDKIWPSLPQSGFVSVHMVQRKHVMELSKKAAVDASLESVRLLRQAGYSDPDRIQAEMREALVSRISQKIAFTQTF